ncbi:universal stress protein [Amnibacterium kyonggiense]|uniref:Nucleotide-binding universal stress UspA family protein n=1 Tax=Amnibacterium kyonggiense TaxID=595671 RepID=A0A4R7FPR0_9MICO|nr:universal stress protein [Amnibacterium kyonggiense]TDS79740.1 nucleotide-binding universal stress UspA family protein [Amnibacterium kyonggiense]
MSAGLPPLIAAYKGPAGPDVLTFATRWRGASGRPVRVVTVYPGSAPVGRGRVDAEWVAYNRHEAESILDGARKALAGTDATFEAIPAESAPRGLHEAMEAAGPGAVAVLGSRTTKGVRRTAPGSTAERLLTGAPGPVVLVPWDYEELPQPQVQRVSVAFIDTPDGRAALEAARAHAAEVQGSVDVVSVLPDTLVRPSLGEPRRFAEGQREDFAASLAEAVLPGERSRLIEGPVVEGLAGLGPEDTDLLVCGSRGYGPARRVLLGGVSARLLRHARVPVMVVPRP